MISRILGSLTGEREISARGEDRVRLLNLIEESGTAVYSSDFSGERFTCRMMNRDAVRLCAECEARGIEVGMSPLLGVGGLVYRYRKRVGVFIGAAFMVVTTFFSGSFIWDFEVVGNENVSTDEILAGLEALGCRVGAYIPSLDFELIANDFLLESDDVAWLSVNMRSSLAVVEVLERRKPLEVPYDRRSEDGCANLIASEDAEIVLPTINSGKRVVSPGDVVRKGELLATGEISVGEDGVRFEYASGQVFAKVYREIRAEIPLEGEKKVYTGGKSERKIVKIFGKSKNLSGNGGIEYSKYDKITDEDKLTVFGTVSLPVTIRTETALEYETVPCVYTESEARSLARLDYRAQLDALLCDAELSSVEKTESFDGEKYVITGKIYLIKDIAEVSEPIFSEQKDTENTDDTKNDNN